MFLGNTPPGCVEPGEYPCLSCVSWQFACLYFNIHYHGFPCSAGCCFPPALAWWLWSTKNCQNNPCASVGLLLGQARSPVVNSGLVREGLLVKLEGHSPLCSSSSSHPSTKRGSRADVDLPDLSQVRGHIQEVAKDGQPSQVKARGGLSFLESHGPSSVLSSHHGSRQLCFGLRRDLMGSVRLGPLWMIALIFLTFPSGFHGFPDGFSPKHVLRVKALWGI